MKILLPDNTEAEIPDDFSDAPYLAEDLASELSFFRSDVLRYVQYLCYRDGKLRERDLSIRHETCCYDIERHPDLPPGLYHVCFVLDANTGDYIREEYELQPK